MRLSFVFLCALLIAGMGIAAPRAWAGVETYHFDRPHTQILFKVSHMGISYSHGKFLDYDGTIQFDRDHPKNSSVQATIQTISLEMNDVAWNKHVRSRDFFDVDRYPKMTFKSRSINVLSDRTADILGDLTLHGVTKPVTLHTTFNDARAIDLTRDYRAGFSATAKIKRSDFGMTTYLPLIGDDVDITIEVESVRDDSAKPETTP